MLPDDFPAPMPHLVRNILALLAGVFGGGFVVLLVQAVNGLLYPPPPGLNFRDAGQMKAYAATLPAGAFLVVLLSYLIGFTVAVFLAARLSGEAHRRQGVLTVLFFGAASVMNLTALPHPWWFWLGNAGVLAVAGWAGLRWGVPAPRAA